MRSFLVRACAQRRATPLRRMRRFLMDDPDNAHGHVARDKILDHIKKKASVKSSQTRTREFLVFAVVFMVLMLAGVPSLPFFAASSLGLLGSSEDSEVSQRKEQLHKMRLESKEAEAATRSVAPGVDEQYAQYAARTSSLAVPASASAPAQADA